MITVDSTKWINDETVKFAFIGLPSDVKPTQTFNGKKIANGSTFLEMSENSSPIKVKMYNADNDTWA